MTDQLTDQSPETITIGQGPERRTIAVRRRDGASPGLFWMGGFKSDMGGNKARALDRWAGEQGRACTRFDYSGHGESSGAFEDGTISQWLEDSLAVFASCRGPQVVVGSSMGGWLALLLARELLRRGAAARGDATIAAMVLIAPAPDFTEALMWKQLPETVRQEIMEKGRWQRPSAYSEDPYVITRALIEDGRKHCILGSLIETGCPVRILQGAVDEDVPWAHAMDLVSHIARDDVVFTLVKDGDHRLSRPEDIERLFQTLSEFF